MFEHSIYRLFDFIRLSIAIRSATFVLTLQIQRELQLRIEAQGQSLQKMLEQQAKLNHPDLPAGATSALTSALASTSAPLGPSNSSMTTTVCEEQPAQIASVAARPAYMTQVTVENVRKEATVARTGSILNEPAAKRARTDVATPPPTFVIPASMQASPSKVAQQAHISQHPGPMAQKSFA